MNNSEKPKEWNSSVQMNDFTVMPNAHNEVCYPMALGTAQTVGEESLCQEVQSKKAYSDSETSFQTRIST